MKLSLRHILPLFLIALATTARAQTGTHDQSSPASNASFNGDATSLIWQQQVRAGLSGQLEGFSVTLWGPAGATLDVRVRIGPGWNTTPIVFQKLLVKPTASYDVMFVDVTTANIQVTPGSLFVLEMQGQGNTGTNIIGSYVDPQSGPPLYPELLFLNAPGCFADCGWRLGFDTYVLNTTGVPYCFGDGSGTACPCGNTGSAGNGCANSVNAAGGNLAAAGMASVGADSLVLSGSGMPNSSALYYQGTSQLNTTFGDGLRCVGGSILRLGTKANTNGASQYPGAGDPPVSVRGAVPAGGGLRTYQIWYRNAAVFCTPATFNLTNAVEVVWGP